MQKMQAVLHLQFTFQCYNINYILSGGSYMFKLLLVEDDFTLRKVMHSVLTQNGYDVILAENGEAALEVLDREFVDILVSDVMMPLLDGFELTKELRSAGYKFPVLLITAKDQFKDMEKGFLVGTDDYMVKPINMQELLLRISALLRRARIINEHKIIIGETTLDFDSLTVNTNLSSTLLPAKEFFLLYKLLSYPEKIFTRHNLMDEIWGMDTETDHRTVDVHIGRLRDKFKDNPDFEIITIRGLGYKAVKKNV